MMDDIFRITMLEAQDGDCFLVEIGEAASPCRLLIDGGRSQAAPSIKNLLESLPRRDRPPVDVLVLTHVDADHIEGLLKLLAGETSSHFGDVWFNGRPQMAAVHGIALPQRLAADDDAARETADVLSVVQGLAFGELVARHRMQWNGAFGGAPAMTVTGEPLPAVDLAGGAVLTLFGPPAEKLRAFAPEWDEAVLQATRDAVLTLRAERPHEKVTPATLRALADSNDRPDKTRPNGSSIAFAIEYQGKRALFAADAHPDDLAKALRRYAPDGKRAVFDLVKAAHHGSARNNTSELMRCLEAPLWLISTDGSRHQHPDPEAMARIVLNGPAGKQLVFNYLSRFNADWSDTSLQAAFGFTARHMTDGEIYSIDLIT